MSISLADIVLDYDFRYHFISLDFYWNNTYLRKHCTYYIIIIIDFYYFIHNDLFVEIFNIKKPLLIRL